MAKHRRKDEHLTIAVIKRRQKVADYVLRGVTDKQQMAAALGVDPQAIYNDLRWIMDNWLKESVRTARRKTTLRVHQQEFAAREAINAWERSKQPAEEVTTEYLPRQCPECRGTGMKAPSDPNCEDWCDHCRGEGRIVAERVTRKIKGQAGDPAHLRLYRDCIADIARLEGLYPKQIGVRVKAQVRLEASTQRQIDYSRVPADVLLGARQALLLLGEAAREQGKDEGQVVDEDGRDAT